MTSWGTFGSGDGEFSHPGTLAVDVPTLSENIQVTNHPPMSNNSSGDLYETGHRKSSYTKFTTEGKYLDSWGNMGRKDSEFDRPAGMDLDSLRDRVYVVDTNNNQIQVFEGWKLY